MIKNKGDNRHPQTTLSLLVGIWLHLSRRRRIQLGLLLAVMLASGVAELVSMGTVLPFLAVLSDPKKLWLQPLVQQLAKLIGLTEPSQMLLPAAMTFATAVVLAAVIRLTNLWLSGRITAAVGSDLSGEAYRRTLYQPYLVHVLRNSSTVISAITNQTDLTVLALNALLMMITATLVALGLLIGLLLIDWRIALILATLFGISYCILVFANRRELFENSLKTSDTSKRQLKVIQEGLSSIREVLLEGSQTTYLQIYMEADRPQRRRLARGIYLSLFPRYSMEASALVIIACVASFLVLKIGTGGTVIPLLGSMALGAQRLLPALQQIYASWATLKAFGAAMDDVLAMLNQPIPKAIICPPPLPFCKTLKLENVCFRYEADQPDILNRLDLEIRPGECIGLIGKTGSGKSTTVDILMGLLQPTSGHLFVDDFDIYDPMHPDRLIGWRANVANVPQFIYLADSSIAENIAFGVPSNRIDMERVRNAAAQAQIASFIESSHKGYDSVVGECGIRLSGGQRQRIGIARALYKQASILIFDEATSALDGTTEHAVMEAINCLSKDQTILIVAHRLSTLERCDRVIRLENGHVVANGPPRLILNRNTMPLG